MRVKLKGGRKLDTKQNLVFYVSDTGIGIPPNKKNIIFERFTQLNQGTNQVFGGTGLGLSIVKGLVELLGGEIWVESQRGKGTTFLFTIFNNTVQPSNLKPAIVQEPEEYLFSDKTILVVEDDIYNIEFLKEILSNKGLNIIYTIYGKEAVQISLTQNVDLVLMNISLPDINGYEATRQIRQSNPNLTIIAQTAYASHDERQKAIYAGCNDYISKPTKQNLLLSMLGKYLTTH